MWTGTKELKFRKLQNIVNNKNCYTFEVKMDCLRQSILSAVFFAYSTLLAQDQTRIDFTPNLKTGDRLVYQMVETNFRQNKNGHYLYLMYDTSYMVFNVREKNDSQTLIDFNYADAIINDKFYVEETKYPNYLKTETYNLVLDAKGEFIELTNWETFASIVLQNIKVSYLSKKLDSNSFKYYFLYYHNQENVEKAVLPRVLELFDLFGKSCEMESTYSFAREIVNPFNGTGLQKSCPFKPSKSPKYPNSIFFSGTIKTNSEDNDCLQEDYYAKINEKRPDMESDITAPYIYIVDSYAYQWGVINKRILSYSTTHTVYLGEDKQGLDRVFTLYAL
jgi:hypothetical protein